MRHGATPHRRHHLHQQGRARDEGACRPAAVARGVARAHRLHLPHPGPEHRSPRAGPARLQARLHHLRQHRQPGPDPRADAQAGGAGRPGRTRALDHLALEERLPRPGTGPAAGRGRRGTGHRAPLRPLPAHAARLQRRRLRRPHRAAHAPVPAAPGGAGALAATAALPAHRRIPGHQPVPVRAGAAAHGGARRLHGGGRRRPEHLRLARRAAGEPGPPAGRLPHPAADQAGAELPLREHHPRQRQPPHRQQPACVREAPVERSGRGREDPRHSLCQCRARGRKGRQRDPQAPLPPPYGIP